VNWTLAIPEIVLTLCGLAILSFGVMYRRGNPAAACSVLTLLSMVLAAILAAVGPAGSGYNDVFKADSFASFIKLLSLAGAVLALLLSLDYNRQEGIWRFEFPVLMLFSTVGTMLMASSGNLMTLYVGLELQSLAVYILCAFNRDKTASAESGLKYFVLGSLASGLLLYGISLTYGFAGTMDYDGLRTALAASTAAPPGLVIGIVFILVGLAFKISAAPFHMWTPDVYQGAPVPVTAFMAGAPKVAAFALLLRVMAVPFGALAPQWQLLVELISMASMLVGSLAALQQTSIKRLMAYSSISHMGYALMGLAAGGADGLRGTLVYLATYIFMNAGSFACIAAMRRRGRAVESLGDLAGLSRSDPLLAGLMALFMFSMIGVPPLSGFFGKLLVFSAAVRAGMPVLVAVGIVSSVIGVVYYFRIVRVMYVDASAGALDPRGAPVSLVGVASGLITALFVLVLGPVATAAQAAAAVLLR